MIYMTFYTLSLLLHMGALYYGARAIAAGESIFTNSSPRYLLHSRVEQKFWTVLLGVTSNLILIPIMLLYLMCETCSIPLWMGRGFSAFHFIDGLITLIWHRITLNDIKNGNLKVTAEVEALERMGRGKSR